MSTDNITELIAQLSLGCDWLRFQLNLREKDLKRIANGEHLFYAVDTNVIYAYADYKNHPGLEFSGLLSSKFASNELKNIIREGIKFLNNYVGIYLFAIKNVQFLIFPKVEEELSFAVREWLKYYEKSVVEKFISEITKEVKSLHLSNLQDISSLIERKRQEIRKWYELERMWRVKRLVKNKKISKMQGSSLEVDGKEIKLPNPEESIEHCVKALIWRKEIEEFYPKEREGIRILNDAFNLSMLEYLNRYLQEKTNGEARLVFITADKNLMAACTEKETDDEDFPTFAECYLRHPLSFLADPEAWPFGEKYNSVAELLPGTVSTSDGRELLMNYRYRRPSWRHYDEAEKVLKEVDRHSGERIVIEFFSNWKNIWKETEKISLVQEFRGELEGEIKSLIDSLLTKDYLESMIKLLIEPTNRMLEHIGTHFDLPRLRELLRGRRYTRGIPPVRFDDEKFPKARELYQMLLSNPENVYNNLCNFTTEEIERVKALIGEDRTFYTFFLYMSVVFYTFSQLDRALMFVNQAIMIGDNLKEKDEIIDGREAYYLSAYIRRLKARNLNELEESKQLLMEAIRRYKKNYQKPNFDFEEILSLDDLRFSSLYMSFEVSKFMFYRYMSREERDLLTEAKKIYENLKKVLTKLSETDKESVERYENRIVKRIILTNLILISIELYDLQGGVQDADKVRDYIRELESNLQKEQKLESMYVKSILQVARCIFQDDCSNDIFDRLRDEELLIFPYDEKKFENYLRLISKIVNRKG